MPTQPLSVSDSILSEEPYLDGIPSFSTLEPCLLTGPKVALRRPHFMAARPYSFAAKNFKTIRAKEMVQNDPQVILLSAQSAFPTPVQITAKGKRRSTLDLGAISPR